MESTYEVGLKNDKASAGGDPSKKEVQSVDRVELSSGYDKSGGLTSIVCRDVEKGTAQEKLGLIKAAIDNGTYGVKSEDIADAILDVRI